MAKRCLALLGLAALVCVSLTAFGGDGGNAGRKTIDLMGEWKLLPVMGQDLPDEIPSVTDKWLSYQAGSYWKDGKHDSAWLVKEIDLTAEDAAKVQRLDFGALLHHARLFINGKKMNEEYWGGNHPWFVRVPDGWLKAGKNQIALGLSDGMYLSNDKDSKRKAWDTYLPNKIDLGKPIYRRNAFDCSQIAGLGDRSPFIGVLQYARLAILPRVYIDDVFVRTSTRKMRLEADIEVVNATDEPQKVWVRGRAVDYAKPNPEHPQLVPETLPDGKVACELWPVWWTLQPGERKIMTVAGSWCDRPQIGLKGPEFWSFENPKLYWFDAQLSTKGEKELADDATGTRFGFREIWIEDGKLYLNGVHTFLWGGSAHYYSGRAEILALTKQERYKKMSAYIRSKHFNIVRPHVCWPVKDYNEILDEMGVMCLVQPPIAAGSGVNGNAEIWNLAKRNYLAYIKAYRNHPCIVIWSTTNEGIFTSGMPDMWSPSISFVIDCMDTYRRLDPTRLYTDSHDYDLRGHSDFFDASYKHHGLWTRFPYGMYMNKSWYFDMDKAWDRAKPLLDDEWGEGFGTGIASEDFGDIVYRAPREGEWRDCGSWFNTAWMGFHGSWGANVGLTETRKKGIDASTMIFDPAYQQLGGKDQIAGYRCVFQELATKNGKPTVAFPANLSRTFLSGKEMRLPYLVINESIKEMKGFLKWTLSCGEETMEFSSNAPWTLKAGTANEIAHGLIPIEQKSGSRQSYDIVAELPKSDKPTAMNLKVELYRGDEPVYTDAQQYSMVPAADLSESPKLALVAGEKSQEFYKSMNASFKIYDVKDAIESGQPVVIGLDAVLKKKEWEALEKFVDEGGRLLVMSRTERPEVFCGVNTENMSQYITVGQFRGGQHPVTAGFNAMDGFWWPQSPGIKEFDEFLVGRDCLARPSQGNYCILIESSLGGNEGGQGPVLCPLMEVIGRKGSAIFCSMMLEEKAAVAPAAALLLKRCVDYLGEKRNPLKPAVVIGADLSRVRAETLPAETELDVKTVPVAVVDASKGIDEATGKRLANFARGGGTVIVHNTQPSTAESVGKVFGIELASFMPDAWLQPNPDKDDVAPKGGFLVRWLDFKAKLDPLFNGMSNYDTNWVKSGGFGRIEEMGFVLEISLKSPSPDVLEIAAPGAILVQKLGKGKVVYDQIRWHVDHSKTSQYCQGHADDYLSILLTNAGVKLAPPAAQYGGFIKEWLFLGPFKIDNSGKMYARPYNAVQLPDEPNYVAKTGKEETIVSYQGVVQKRAWVKGKVDVRSNPSNNLNDYFISTIGTPEWTMPTWDWYVAYAQAYVDSPEEQDCLITGDADDIFQVYANGKAVKFSSMVKKIFDEVVCWGSQVNSPDSFQARLHLKKGRNKILLKTANGLGGWGFVLQLKDLKHPVTFSVE